MATRPSASSSPPLYEEYFSSWPPTPMVQDVEAAGGNTSIATIAVRKVEEIVRD